MKQKENCYTREDWMKYYGIVDEGSIVSEEDLMDSDSEEGRE